MSNPVSIIVWPENYLEAPDQPVSTLVVRRPMEHEVTLTRGHLKMLANTVMRAWHPSTQQWKAADALLYEIETTG